MLHTKADPFWMKCFRIQRCKEQVYEGKTIEEIAKSMQVSPLDAILNLLAIDPNTLWVQFVDKKRPNRLIQEFLKYPYGMPSTDTQAYPSEPDIDSGWYPTPIAYGLYPHYLRVMMEENLMSLEEMVHKATGLPAQRFGIEDRGILKQGAYADMVVFNQDTIGMVGGFNDPARKPEGIEWVLVNGAVVYENQTQTCERRGQVLRKKKSV
jgi:N-acyl-D-aspartate/D-glutamate deacylase